MKYFQEEDFGQDGEVDDEDDDDDDDDEGECGVFTMSYSAGHCKCVCAQ